MRSILKNFYLILKVFGFATIFFVSSKAMATEQEDVRACVLAAKLYGNQTVPMSGYKYDKGFFSSDISWTSPNRVFCTLSGSQVTDLHVNNKTLVIDGFSGFESKKYFEKTSKQFEKLKSAMKDFSKRMDRDLKILKTKLQQPNLDLLSIKQKFELQISNSSKRLNASDEELLEFLSKDIDIIAEMRKKIESAHNQITELKKSLSEMQNEKNQLAQTLGLYKEPILPIKNQIISSIKNEDFKIAGKELEHISTLPLYNEMIKKQFIEVALQVARPIPAAEIDRNLKAYEFLNKLEPENLTFIEKINLYESKRAEAQKQLEIKRAEAQKQSRIKRATKMIKLSDDFNLYRDKMALAALDLTESGKCTQAQIEYVGGWVKSPNRKGHYFLDCGSSRYWLDINKSSRPTTDAHVSQTVARDACWKSIKARYKNAKIQILSNNFKKHTVGSVTYVQDFKAKNLLGQTMKYKAFCVIQSDRTMEVTISTQ